MGFEAENRRFRLHGVVAVGEHERRIIDDDPVDECTCGEKACASHALGKNRGGEEGEGEEGRRKRPKWRMDESIKIDTPWNNQGTSL